MIIFYQRFHPAGNAVRVNAIKRRNKNKQMKYFYIGSFLLLCTVSTMAQKTDKPPMPKDSAYLSNIKKSTLYGVYIPRDIDDALDKLMELTTEEARKPMVRVNEDTIARKLHFGLGRWMEYNWNFVEGSRFSHVLRQKGFTYSDDMVKYMLVLFHRKVSNKPLDADILAEKILKERKELVKKGEAEMPVVKTEIKKIPKNE